LAIGIIGCGYVFDHYMATWARHRGLTIAGIADSDPTRRAAAAKAYGLHAYPDNAAMLADREVTIVVNLTSIESHYEVTRAALLAGKHVYSEKPLVTDLALARELFALAEVEGLRLSCAPSNALGDSSQTLWKAVRDGAVGDVRIVYAEFDDNVIYRMHPETWASRTGAPWPYLHEYEAGCTYEHVGYHLTWLCAIFGPVESVTAFSKVTLPDKTDQTLHPADTPDFSVACLNFASGLVARVTCSIGVPFDHRVRVVGNLGMLSVDTYRHYQCPVFFERFSQLTLNARKARAVRTSSILQSLFGIGGKPLDLLRNPPPGAGGRDTLPRVRWWSPPGIIRAVKRSQLGQQDKTIGIAELADAIATGRPSFPPHDFSLHLTELTIAIQNAGVSSGAIKLETSFVPVQPRADTLASPLDYSQANPPSRLTRLADKRLRKMHKH
jgi:predicted dehydrogenase